MNRAYYLVRKRLKKQSQKNIAHYNRAHNVRNIEYKVGDPVYLKNHNRTNKLDALWLPHYRIIVKKGKSSYIIQNQVTGRTRRAHVAHLHLASSEEAWNQTLPPNPNRRIVRDATHDLASSESELSEAESDNDSQGSNEDPAQQGTANDDSTDSENASEESDNSISEGEDEPPPPKSDIPSRPQRVAKSRALSKMKNMRAVSATLPTAAADCIPNIVENPTDSISITQPNPTLTATANEQSQPDPNIIENIVNKQLLETFGKFMQSLSPQK